MSDWRTASGDSPSGHECSDVWRPPRVVVKMAIVIFQELSARWTVNAYSKCASVIDGFLWTMGAFLIECDVRLYGASHRC